MGEVVGTGDTDGCGRSIRRNGEHLLLFTRSGKMSLLQ